MSQLLLVCNSMSGCQEDSTLSPMQLDLFCCKKSACQNNFYASHHCILGLSLASCLSSPHKDVVYAVRDLFHHDLRAESEVHGPGRQRAEEGQWFRLHGQGKTASQTDAGIVKMALAVLDADVRRTMYQQPLLSQDKFTGMPLPSTPSSGCS